MYHMLKTNTACYNAELLAQLKSGDERAFKKIYEEYRSRIYRVAIKYSKCEMQAQEIVQEVFLKLWVNRSEIRTGAPIEAWLFTVAKNNSLNRFQKTVTENKVKQYLRNASITSDDSTFNRVLHMECASQLHKALQSLSQNQLLVYQLAREENLSHLEIATHLNISRLTVKTHMSRALKHLKLHFAQV